MAKRKKGSKYKSEENCQEESQLHAGRAKAKPKRAPVKKAARRIKAPVAPVVETVAVEVIEQPAPDVITVTEVEETEIRKAS